MVGRAPNNELSSPFASVMPYAPSERRVGKYRIVSELGRGGTATVYLAVARGRGGVSKLVVLKALLPEFVGDPDVVTMFVDEARVAAQLNHPNVVQTYEIGTEGGRNVIVMEYMEGQSLSRLNRRAELAQQPLPQIMHLAILTHVLEGLHYAHELNSYDGVPLELVHRDISPQNVFVTYDGQVKILDFGIAKTVSSSRETGLGLLKGKISYMAPEQMQSEHLDRRADIYAAGCMLWAAAAGRKLWKEISESQILDNVSAGRVPLPSSVNPNCPAELERITMRALAFRREDRYATAAEMQAELEAFIEPWGMPRPRELGALVSNLFANDRQALRSHVEQQLAALSSETQPDIAAFGANEAEEMPWLSDTRRGPIDSSVGLTATSPPVLKRRRWPWVSLVAVIAGAATALALPWVPRAVLAQFGLSEVKLKSNTHASRTNDSSTGSIPASGHLPPRLIVPIPEAYVADYRSEPEAGPLSGLAASAGPARPTMLPPTPVFATKSSKAQVSIAPPPISATVAPSTSGVSPEGRGTIHSEGAPANHVAPGNSDAARARCNNPFFIDADGIKRLRTECY